MFNFISIFWPHNNGPTIIYDQRAVKFLQEFEIRKLRERGWDGPS